MKQYIEFTLGTENYAVELGYVREIIKPVHIFKLLGASEFVKGVSKIRDDVITIIDFRKKFNIDLSTCIKGEPRIVIFEFGSENVGLLVDDAVEIFECDNIEKVSGIIHFGIVREIAKLEDKIIPILDVECLFSSEVSQWLNSETISQAE